MSNKIWRGGMVGAGAWSEVQLTAWAGVPNAEIVALTDRHPDRRDPVVQRFEIPDTFDDFETMLDEAELDFVDICVRPYSHAPLTKLAAERGGGCRFFARSHSAKVWKKRRRWSSSAHRPARG
jgi:predicted dehydrogenase